MIEWNIQNGSKSVSEVDQVLHVWSGAVVVSWQSFKFTDHQCLLTKNFVYYTYSHTQLYFTY